MESRISDRLWTAVVIICFCLLGLPMYAQAKETVLSGMQSLPASLSSPPVEAIVGGGRAPVVVASMSPEAVAEREASRTLYEGLGGEGVVGLAERVFGVERPGWVAPGTQDGGHLTKYLSEHNAVEATAGGTRVLVSSSVPLRSAIGSGQLEPVSMVLEDHGSAFAPANPLSPVSFSKEASGGMEFPLGLTVAPGGAASGESVQLVGDRVVYPSIARDTDFMAEALPWGVELAWQLRSQNSPQENALTFGLPAGATLQMSGRIPGGVEVVKEGQVLMAIDPAVAREADGVSLPVSYMISGNTLTTHVDLSGSVSFPVLVDPLITGYYGLTNNANVWSGWESWSSCGCFEFYQDYRSLETGTHTAYPGGTYGEWLIEAPGGGEQGGASITRVDITGMGHYENGQSEIQAGIQESNGSLPSWTFNGIRGNEGRAPFASESVYNEAAMAFCAEEVEGGKDGGGNPLCEETNYGGRDFYIADVLGPNSLTTFNYAIIRGADVVYLDNTKPNEVAIHNLPTKWVKYGPVSSVYITGHDQGVGVQALTMEIPPGYVNENGQPFFAQEFNCSGQNGFAGCPAEATSSTINLSEVPTGVSTVDAYAYDAVGNWCELHSGSTCVQGSPPKLYVDHTGPKTLSFGGSLGEANGKVIGNGSYTLLYGAEDGNSGAPQSGVRSLDVYVDGAKVSEVVTACAEPVGEPASNCFSLNGSWTMEGQKYGAGIHTITVTAKDWVGNESSGSMSVTVNEAPSQPVGPGVVNVKTGDYKLAASDVSIGGPGAALSLSRSYDSRQPAAGASGPLGPQWSLSMPDMAAHGVWQNLKALANGSVQATLASGAVVVFSPKEGGGFVSPAGYQTEALIKASSTEYRLRDAAGNATIFTRVSGGEEAEPVFVPSGVMLATNAQGLSGLDEVTYTFMKTAEGIVEPTEVIGPPPASVTCPVEPAKPAEALKAGCRALTFNYATLTTAKGESPGEWGDYKGRLTRVYFTAWSPVSKAMTTTTVAQYAYDLKGRLRAEWDPRISPELKTEYGYDGEGHITALTGPGQETWAVTYGTVAGDANAGRALKVLQAPASTLLWKGEGEANTEAPRLSGAAVIGVRMSVSDGVWSTLPVAYSYQWEDCNSSGGECKPILGASNLNYTPTTSDIGHRLVAQVIATNGSGSVTATSAASVLVGPGVPNMPGYASQFGSFGSGNGQVSSPWDISSSSTGNVYVADKGNNRVEEFNSEGVFVRVWGSEGAGNGQFKHPEGITVDSKSNVWVVDHNNDRVEEFTSEGAFIRAFGSLGSGNGQLNLPEGVEVDSKGNVWVADQNNNRIEEFTGEGAFIRTVGSLGAGNGQFKAPGDVTVDAAGNVWVADTGNNRIQEFTSEGAFVRTAGSVGTGNGQFSSPYRLTAGPENTLWVSDSTNNRVQILTTKGEYEYQFGASGTGAGQFSSPTGVSFYGPNVYVLDRGNNRVERWIMPPRYVKKFGSVGSGNGQLSSPWDISSSSTGNVYVADKSNNRVEEFNSESAFVRVWGSEGTGNGQFKHPEGITVDSKSNVWVVDHNNDRVEEFTSEGAFIRAFGSLGSGNGQLNLPEGVEVDSKGNVWVADQNNNRVEEFTGEGAFVRIVGSLGTGNGQFKAPGDVTVDAAGNVWVADTGNNRLQEFTSEGAFVRTAGSVGTGNGQFSSPYRLTNGPENTIWVSDSNNNRVQVLTTKGEYRYQFGTLGEYEAQFKSPTGVAFYGAKVYVLDRGNNRVSVWTREMNGERAEGEQRAPQPGTTIEYNVPLSGSGLPTMTKAEVEKWAEKDLPAEATAIFPPDEAQSWPASDYKRANIYYLDSMSRIVNVRNPMGGISTTEYDSTNNQTRTLTATNRATALKEAKPAEAAEHLGTNLTYTSEGTELASILGPEHKVKLPSSSEAQARKQVTYTYDEGAPAEGGPYRLVTTTKEAALVAGKEEDLHTVKNSYSGGSGLGWTLHKPTSITTDPEGLKLTHNTSYSATTGAVIETQMPGGGTSGNTGAHNSQIIYYTSGNEASVAACQNHPEWANLPCQTQPVHQPETSGLPSLPVTTYTYNMLDEPEATKSTAKNTLGQEATRTETTKYDEAGRTTSKETSSTVGVALPKINYEYSTQTGMLVKQSTGTGTEEQTIKEAFNNIGEMTEYTDANGKTAVYEYENGGDARLKHFNDGKGSQTLEYGAVSGMVAELADSAAGTFNATYDIEGRPLTETLPDGLTSNLAYNAAGEVTSFEYTKKVSCGPSCTWFKDTVVPSIHGQWMSQTSTQRSGAQTTQSYAHDGAGRLTQVQNTPPGKGCITRVYAYDLDSNRTALTTYPPNAENKCATAGGTTESHSYDTADRLTDTGLAYNTFGDIETLSATDAGGTSLTSTYYADGQTQHQEQGTQAIGYGLDPARRIQETISTGKVTATETQNYPAPGNLPSWSSEPSGNWTRNIGGINGTLEAIQHNGETPILQISNLHGDIIATATDSETATELASTIGEANEWGIPATEAPPKYSWLGAHQLPTELPSGVTAMGSRSYIPQLGRFLQPDPSPGGSANAYAYTYGNPTNEIDLSGAWSLSQSSGGGSAIGSGSGELAEEGGGIAAGAIMPPPVNIAEEEAYKASLQADQATAGTEEYEEYEEEEYGEEWGEEYVAFVAQPDENGNGLSLIGSVRGYESEILSTDKQDTVSCRQAKTELESKADRICVRFADFLGIGKAVKKAVRKIKKAWKAIKEWGHDIYCGGIEFTQFAVEQSDKGKATIENEHLRRRHFKGCPS